MADPSHDNDRNQRVTTKGNVFAAEYVRMSTEHQRYSTENQADAIRAYAKARGIQIVRTYADEGKSGLKLDGRDALKQLIRDVQSGNPGFTMILVYDVSRWGRFQDADESAYYEYICKRPGAAVQYCAEQFENDGSPVSTIVKGVKRAMAGEYSRELSAKVFAGQCHLIELGYRQGGTSGYGLRRALLDETGAPKCLLSRGQQKSLQTDRVILVPGPDEEVETVRWMFHAFAKEGKLEREIAVSLNDRGRRTDLGRPWTRGTVHQVLINEKYIGNNVWNRTSFKLKRKRVRNQPEMWIRSDKAFDPIVDLSLFYAAQAIVRERSRRLSDEEMLDALKQLFGQNGFLTALLIDESSAAPSSSAYRSRFRSLLAAYELVGYMPEHDYRFIEINRALRALAPGFLDLTLAGVKDRGGRAMKSQVSDLVSINGEFTVSVAVVRCRMTAAGSRRWLIELSSTHSPDITVAVRMDEANGAPRDFYVLPRIGVEGSRLKLADDNGMALDAFRFESLEPLFDLAARVPISKVA